MTREIQRTKTAQPSLDWRQRLQSTRVLVAGDVMLDRYWFGAVDRISPEAPVPVVRIGRTEERLGGAANVARNLASLGAQATLLGVVGADEAADRIRSLLASAGVHDRLATDEGAPTIVKLRVVGRGQQLLRADFEQPPSDAVLADKLDTYSEALAQQDMVILSDYGKGALSHVARQIGLAKSIGLRVLIDPKGDEWGKYAGAWMLTPNRSELQQVVGRWRDEADLKARAQKLRDELGLEWLLLTRSEEGMTLFGPEVQGDDSFHVPAQAREVYDVSGAGDTVIATMAAFLSAGADPRDATVWANRAGGIVVGKLGTAVVTPSELFAHESPTA